MTYGEPTKMDKIVPIVAGVILLAFFACVPSMYADKQRREQELWQTYGCQKYDEYKATDLPAKCSNDFTDHYKPQEQRTQPNHQLNNSGPEND